MQSRDHFSVENTCQPNWRHSRWKSLASPLLLRGAQFNAAAVDDMWAGIIAVCMMASLCSGLVLCFLQKRHELPAYNRPLMLSRKMVMCLFDMKATQRIIHCSLLITSLSSYWICIRYLHILCATSHMSIQVDSLLSAGQMLQQPLSQDRLAKLADILSIPGL